MGLRISGEITKKECSWSYFPLHLIRYLAYLSCGLGLYIKRNCFDMTLWASSVNYKDLSEKEIKEFQFCSNKVGYFFPNLIFHSDCNGSYSRKNSVMKNSDLKTGNSKGLLKELTHIKNNLENNPELFKNWESINDAKKYFYQFYELVKDEVENGKGIIYFS